MGLRAQGAFIQLWMASVTAQVHKRSSYMEMDMLLCICSKYLLLSSHCLIVWTPANYHQVPISYIQLQYVAGPQAWCFSAGEDIHSRELKKQKLAKSSP